MTVLSDRIALGHGRHERYQMAIAETLAEAVGAGLSFRSLVYRVMRPIVRSVHAILLRMNLEHVELTN
jgi:hypothetical protein